MKMKKTEQMKKTMKQALPALVFALALIPGSLYARCPISANGTLEVVAPAGNLFIDTSGTDGVDWDINSKQITATETCTRDKVRIEGTSSGEAIKPIPDWHIKVPKTVILDLVTRTGGNITIGPSDSAVIARTGGGNVVIGNVRGETTIVTHAGNIQAGDIGGNADLKSSYGGNLALGTVTGDLSIWTQAGDITIQSAGKIVSAFTGGGNMLIHKVLGSFSGHNDAGSIHIDQAGSWVDASTGSGNIYLRMVPTKQTGDLHVNLEAKTGDITLFLPNGMKADIQATGLASQIHTDFPLVPKIGNSFSGIPQPPKPGAPSSFTTTQTGTRNGGGNPVKLHTALGKIEIKLFN